VSILKNLFKKRKNTKKTPKNTPEQRLLLREDKYLQWLQRNDFQTYKEIMEQKIKKGFGIKPTKEEDNIAITLRTLRQLREEKLIDDPRTAGQDDWWKDLARGLAPVLGMMMMPQQQAQIAQQQEQAQMGQQQIEQETYTEPVVAKPKPIRRPPPPIQEAPKLLAIESLPEEDEQMSMISWYLISQLDKKTPEEATAWLISQDRPEAKQFVEALLQTPLEQLPGLMSDLEKAEPKLSGFINWLRRDRADWFVKTVQIIKARANGAGTVTAAAGKKSGGMGF